MSKTIDEMTESEFLNFVTRVCRSDYDTEEEHDDAILEFERLTEHPDGSDLIFYPRDNREDSPAGVVEEVKTWREANGKPGFKVL